MDNSATLSDSCRQLHAIVDRMSLALAAVDEAIAWTDGQGSLQWCNAAFERLAGQSVAALVNQPLPVVLPLALEGDTLPSAVHPVPLGLATQQAQTGMYEFDWHDRTLWLAINVTLLPPTEPELPPQGALVVIRNVTAQPAQSLLGQSSHPAQAAALPTRAAESGEEHDALAHKRWQARVPNSDSRQLFREVFESTIVGSVIVSAEGAYLQVNAAYCQMLGYTEAELLALTFQQVTHPDDLERDLALVQQLEAGEIPYFHIEKRYLHRDGHTVWGLLSVSAIRDAQQTPLYYMTQVQDISDRKRAETALRESEQWFRSVFESTAVGMVVAAPDGSLLQVNAAYCQMLGYTLTELATKTCQQLVHPDDFARGIEPLRQLLAGERAAYHTERRYFHKQGHIVWGLVSLATVRDVQQQPLYVVYQVQDISERKQAEAALHESEARLKLALEAAQMSTWEWNPITNEVIYSGAYLNPGFDLPSDVQGNAYEACVQAIHPDDRAYVQNALARALEGADYNAEFRVIWADGTERWVCSKGKTYFNELCMPIRMLGVLRDITPYKQSEQALQQLNQELEQRVQKRTTQIELANQHLQTVIAAHEQTEAALRQSEERFRIIFDSAPIAISLADAHTYQIVEVNRAHRELFGYSPAELKTLTHVDITHPDDAGKNRDYIRQLLEGKITRAQLEKRFVKKNGDWIWANLTVALIRSLDGRAYTLGMIEDITDRKHAEETLRDNQQFLQLVIDNVPNRIFWKDKTLRYLGCNRQFAIDAGFATPQDVIGKTDFELPRASHAERFRAEDVQVLTSKQPILGVEECLAKAGAEQRWITISKMPLHNTNGSVIGVLGTYEDITERRKTDQALRLTQFSIDRAVDPIWWVKSDGSIYYVNDAACRDLGCPREDIIGKNVADFNPDRPVEAWADHWQAVKDQGSLTFEARLKAKDGTFFPIEVTANHIELHGTAYHCSFVRNTTKRKQAEAQLRASLAEKEALLKEVHHRVKNNLQMVSSLLNLQLDTIQDPQVLAPLRDSLRRIKAMALVHERLYRSDHLETVNFSDYVHHLVTDLIHSYSADPDKIRLRFELTPLALPLSTAISCGLIINELVTNALKHAFPGDRTGEIQIAFAMPTDDRCLLVIADDGVGFLASMASLDTAQPTNSLGLQLVHAFGHQLRGTIALNCSHGTRFELSFPHPNLDADER